MEIKTLEDLYAMELHEIWQPNKNDIVLRVPGGWVYTVMTHPVFVAEPHPMITYTSERVVDDDDEHEDDILEIIEKLEEEDNDKRISKIVRGTNAEEDSSVPCLALHCDGCSGNCGQDGETTPEIRVCDEGVGEDN